MTLDEEVTSLCQWIQRTLGDAADCVADSLGGSVWRVDVSPMLPTAAPATILVSDAETILEAGRSFRAELSRLPASRDRVIDIMTAIAAGDLRERVANGRGRFELRLGSGAMIRGSQNRVSGTSKGAEVFEYTPYVMP